VVEVLANGDAVASYVPSSSNTVQMMNELAKSNVTFVACNNSIHGMKISAEDLLPFVKLVPVGVVEIIQKQNEGYAYIKP
jgi:intracellular sulfur oxidation DsrE/DsrF family protein